MKIAISIISLLWALLSSLIGEGLSIQPESNLQSNCYHFPKKDFSASNCIKCTYGSTPKIQLPIGSDAIDFTLTSSKGEKIVLSDILKKSAVVLIWGMATCPAFRGYVAENRFLGSSYSEENSLKEVLGDNVEVLHIVSSEPHPTWPYANFDTGNIRINLWSTISQPQTYAERMAISLPPVTNLLSQKIQVLIDDLVDENGQGRSNPVWCTYGHAARASFFIGQDGRIHFSQEWFNGPAMVSFIKDFLKLLYDVMFELRQARFNSAKFGAFIFQPQLEIYSSFFEHKNYHNSDPQIHTYECMTEF